jgi:hypothetical protein
MTNKLTNPAKGSQPVTGRQNYLVDKVVLLIGNDIAVLQTIIIQLAQKGADVALICQKISRETLHHVRENVESVGRRLLVLEEVERKPVSAERLIQIIVLKLGHLDIFIDLSTPQRKLSPLESEKEQTKEWFPSGWSLMQAALQEIA